MTADVSASAVTRRHRPMEVTNGMVARPEATCKVLEIPFTKGAVALIDEEDLDLIGGTKWRLQDAGGYAVSKINGRKHFMHRIILNAPDGMYVDHINGIGTDNRKCNLRLCTPAQNNWNSRPYRNGSSAYKGVYWYALRSRWKARITVLHKIIYLGTFTNEVDAALAYDAAARLYFGEFARTNFEVLP